MGVIDLDPSVLRTAAKDMAQAIDDLDRVATLIGLVENDVGVYWQSGWTDHYVENLQNTRRGANSIESDLEYIRNSLQSLASRAEQAEREAQQAVQSGF